MSAPTAINVHGADPLIAVADELTTTTVTLAVSDLGFEDGRTIEDVKDTDMKVIRTKALDANLKITLKGQASTLTGVVAAKVGYAVTSLTNFAAAILDYDPAVGTIICTSNKRSVKKIQDQTEVDLAFVHRPYVVDA